MHELASKDAKSLILNNFSIGIIPNNGFLNKVSSKQSDVKYIVQNINVQVKGATLFAILGGSGSGKTTLLNVIAGRYSKSSLSVSGNIVYQTEERSSPGDRDPNRGFKTVNIGYVTQQDYLLPFLTVRETLLFAARIKKDITNDASNTDLLSLFIDKIILDLGLKECSNSLIADDANAYGGKRGISGGEKRRVSIGIQLISDPEVLCADEPTSGLDAFTALTVMESLQRLSQGIHKTTIICSIHQPRADVFNMFHSVLLLSKGGHAIYCGPVSQMFSYFSKLNYPCPVDSNPADYYVDISSIDHTAGYELEQESKQRVRSLIKSFTELSSNVTQSFPHLLKQEGLIDGLNIQKQGRTSNLLRQIYFLVDRNLKNIYRDWNNVMGGIVQVVILSLVIMGMFWQLDDSITGIQSRNGLMYIVASMESYILMVTLVERYCATIPSFDRELQDDMYSPTAYLLANIIATSPQFFIQGILYSLPIYFGCNLRPGFIHIFLFVGVNILLQFLIDGLVWMCVSLQRPFSIASLITNFNYTFIGLTSGFLVNFDSIPIYVQWVRNLSFQGYTYRILLSNEMSNRQFGNCGNADDVDDLQCVQYQGNFDLSSQGVDVDDYTIPTAGLVAIMCAYYLVACVALNFIRFPVTGMVGGEVVTQSETDDSDATYDDTKLKNGDRMVTSVVGNVLNPMLESGYQRINVNEDPEISTNRGSRPRVNIKISNLSLFVQQSNASASGKDKLILESITAEFTSNRLTAIMGGSGSGKTTLLNLIANRIPQNCLVEGSKSKWDCRPSSKYVGTGSILFNGKKIHPDQLRQLVGYVQQFDFHLPSLTVKETLLFQAKLRLDLNISDDARDKVVENVIHILGLQGCRQTRVGGAELKGISGGEKRRLSIGVQLLVDPAVCLLDEPTTGLDSFTARHVVETLKELATVRGRMVVMSIHQPRYDVFHLIDDVVLLSRGHLIWSGPVSEMLNHFSKLGHPCPSLVNPADFILDLSSVDTRNSNNELISLERYKMLVNSVDKVQSSLSFLESFEGQSSPGIEENDNFVRVDLQTPLLLANDKHNESRPIASSHEKGLIFSMKILLERSYMNMIRQPTLFSTRMSQGLSFALILACFYAPVGNDQASVQDRIGVLYEMTALCFIGMLSCIAIFPIERNIFFREYLDGSYSVMAFLLTYYILAIPTLLVGAILIGFLMSTAIGLKPDFDGFVTFSYAPLCLIFTGDCIGVIFCALFDHVGVAINFISVVLAITSIIVGYISLDMPMVFTYINYFSPVRYGSWVMANTAFKGLTFTCSSSQRLADGQCPYTTGDQILDLYGMNGDEKVKSTQISLLLVVTFVVFLLSLIVFRIKGYIISH